MQKLSEISKSDYEVNRLPSMEDIQVSAIVRIANATEKMAGNYTNLQNDLERQKSLLKQSIECCDTKDKTISNLRGQITKLKNKLSLSINKK